MGDFFEDLGKRITETAGAVTKKTEEVVAENPGKKLVPHYTVKEFVESLETPRRILLMVKAGAGTDAAIDSLKPYLDKGDIIIDGGNTFFQDTIRRNRELSAEGFNFMVPVFPAVKRCIEWSFYHAGRFGKRLGRSEACFAEYCCQSIRRHALLSVGGTGRFGTFCQDDS